MVFKKGNKPVVVFEKGNKVCVGRYTSVETRRKISFTKLRRRLENGKSD